jgi:hypothetical protein
MFSRHRCFGITLTLLSVLVLGEKLEAQGSQRAPASLVYISPDNSTLVFERRLGTLNRIMGGDVIVSPVSPLTPDGLLRRVVDVSRAGRELTLTTESATLEDVFWSGSVRKSIRMSRADVSRVRIHARGARLRDMVGEDSRTEGAERVEEHELADLAASDIIWSPSPIEVDLLDVVLFDLDKDLTTTDDQVTLTGQAGVAPTFELDLDVSWGRVRRFSFTNQNEVYTWLELDGRVFVPVLNTSVTIATVHFNPVIVMVGPVPLVFTPILDINAGAIGNLTAEVHTKVTAGFPVSAGIVYENRQWQAFTDLPDGIEDIQIEWERPQLLAEVYAQAYAGPRFSFLLYGVAGPFAEVQGYTELFAVILPNPNWTVYLGIRGSIGLFAPF